MRQRIADRLAERRQELEAGEPFPAPEEQHANLGRLNLGVWKPGQSGNPAGRPKLAPLSKAYREKLDEPCPFMRGRTWAQAIATKMVRLAFMGNLAAAAEIADRAEGKPRQALTIAREEENVDTIGIIQRLAGLRTPDPEPGVVAPGSTDATQ